MRWLLDQDFRLRIQIWTNHLIKRLFDQQDIQTVKLRKLEHTLNYLAQDSGVLDQDIEVRPIEHMQAFQ